MKNLIIFIAMFGLGNYLCAQQHTNWLNYTYTERVRDLDISGDNIWISTDGGLIKYDKITGVKTYYNRANSNIPDNNLIAIFCDENEKVWVGGKFYGIGKLEDAKCTIYNESNSGIPFNQYNTKIKRDNHGNLWIASFCWMAKFNGTQWKTWITGSDLHAFPIISDFEIDGNNNVWVCSTDGLGKISDGEYKIIDRFNGTINRRIVIDRNKNIWFSQRGQGLYRFNGSSFTNFNSNNSCLPSNIIGPMDFDIDNKLWITSSVLVGFDTIGCDIIVPPVQVIVTIKCDENGTIWFGTFNGQLLKFDGSEFSIIDLSDSPLKSKKVFPLFLDSENNVWLGTEENTVKSTPNGLVEIFDKEISSGILDKNGAVWLAFNTGDTCLLQIKESESIVFDSTNSPFNTSKISISHINIDNKNDLWISTNGHGLFKYDGTYFTNYTTENSLLPSNIVFQMAFNQSNDLWCGTANGLLKFDGENWTIWNTGNSSIPTNVVNGLIIDSDDKIWFSCMDERRIVGGEYGGGLTKFDGNIMTTFNMSNSGLTANTFFGLLDDGDKLWLATYGTGLICFDKTDSWEVFDVTNSGIADNRVQGLIKDKNGNIWMGHNDAGISVFNPDSAIQTVGLINEQLNNSNSKLLIYPNPVKNELFVNIELADKKITKAEISDLSGRVMQIIPEDFYISKGPIYNFRIQPNLPENQIFILSLKVDNGEIFSGRFIISR